MLFSRVDPREAKSCKQNFSHTAVTALSAKACYVVKLSVSGVGNYTAHIRGKAKLPSKG